MNITKLPVMAGAASLVRDVYPKFKNATGTISYDDALFLLSLIDMLNAKIVFEVGVASGSSTSLILSALNTKRDNSRLIGFDIAANYYADQTKPLAFLVDDLGLDRNRLSIFPETMSPQAIGRLQELPERHLPHADLIFIDAHHSHPWVSLDLLSMLGALRQNGCIVLHDIALPDIMKHGAEFGPKYLFNNISSPRFVSDVDVPNIGAVIVDDISKLIDETIDLSLIHI